MEYAELKLYNRQGGDAFTKKNIIDNTKEDLNENDKKVLKMYRKKIIEKRNEINRLKKLLESYENKQT